MSREAHRLMMAGLVLGCIGCVFGLAFAPKAMLTSYLAVWFAFAAVPSGALAVLLTSYLVRGEWTGDLYPILSRAALALPIFAAFFLPVLLGADHVYPWLGDAAPAAGLKAYYLTLPLFTLRAAIYFAALTGLAWWATRSYGNERAMKQVASAGLIAWPLLVSFAAIDWLESAEPDFHSSIYGLLAVSFHLLAGLGFALAVLFGSRRRHRMRNGAYGAVLLAVILLWAYLHAMQYIVIWSGNIPDEVGWYLARISGGWGIALLVLHAGQFGIPFFALLSSRIRRSGNHLLQISLLTLALRVLEAAILIVPAQHLSATWIFVTVGSALLFVGCGSLLTWSWTAGFRALWPARAATEPR